MKLVNIPPYQRAGVNYDPALGHFAVRELIANMREKGQLEGIEIDIDDGYKTDHSAETRDEEVGALITVGFIKREQSDKFFLLEFYRLIVSSSISLFCRHSPLTDQKNPWNDI